MRIAVIDSSVLINLTYLGLSAKLSLYFTAIYVPRRVQEEVNKKFRFRSQLNKLYRLGLFQRCACGDATSVSLLKYDLDAGEAEGLVQAREIAAEFFMVDELRARRISERQGLTPIGTVRLLARLHLEGYAEDTWFLVDKLRNELRFRVDNEVVERAIKNAAAPI